MTLHATELRRLESEARRFPVGAIQSCHYPPAVLHDCTKSGHGEVF
jgi:hypothetical protein